MRAKTIHDDVISRRSGQEQAAGEPDGAVVTGVAAGTSRGRRRARASGVRVPLAPPIGGGGTRTPSAGRRVEAEVKGEASGLRFGGEPGSRSPSTSATMQVMVPGHGQARTAGPRLLAVAAIEFDERDLGARVPDLATGGAWTQVRLRWRRDPLT